MLCVAKPKVARNLGGSFWEKNGSRLSVSQGEDQSNSSYHSSGNPLCNPRRNREVRMKAIRLVRDAVVCSILWIATAIIVLTTGCAGVAFSSADLVDSGTQTAGGASSLASSATGGTKLTESSSQATGGSSPVASSAATGGAITNSPCPCPGPCELVDGSGLRCAYQVPAACSPDLNWPCAEVHDSDGGQLVCYTCKR